MREGPPLEAVTTALQWVIPGRPGASTSSITDRRHSRAGGKKGRIRLYSPCSGTCFVEVSGIISDNTVSENQTLGIQDKGNTKPRNTVINVAKKTVNTGGS